MTDVIAGAPLAHALGLALLHFVWQGALLGVLTALALAALTGRSASVRYLVACAGLVAMLGAPAGTWLAYSAAAAPATASPLAGGALEPSTAGAVVIRHLASDPAPPASWLAPIEPLAPGAVAIWSLGVVILTLRLLGGCLRVEALKRRSTAPLPAEWRRRVAELAAALGVTRMLNGVESSLVDVPTVVGWVRPLILVPTSALAGLTPSQLEAILAHEIAHIRRHDYLVNVIQHVIETLLFYHPAVWWLSRRVRIERELCCDDVAVGICGDRVVYASALTSLEELRGSMPTFAVAADGGHLLSRVRRLLEPPPTSADRSSAWTAIVVALLVAILPAMSGGITGAATESHASPRMDARLSPAPTTTSNLEPPADTRVSRLKDRTGSGSVVAERPATQTAGEAAGAAELKRLHDALQAVALRAQAQASAAQAPLPVQETIYVRSSRTPPNSRVIPPSDTPTSSGSFGAGARKPGNGVSFPRLVHEEKPIYTPEAMAHGVQGSVELEVIVMENGTVGDLRVIRSLDRTYGLDQQAIAAARQWLFEPARDREGVPVPVLVTLVLDFRLEKTTPAAVRVTPPAGARVTPPHQLRRSSPAYPALARQSGAEGTVVVRALTDVSGRVRQTRIMQSVPGLDDAAVQAVRQWEYTPALVNDVAVPLEITATFHFSLTDAASSSAAGEAGAGAPIRVGGAVREPKKIVNVPPVYPQAARDAGIQGMVILEATIDPDGNVTDARVLRSVPMLDEAALQAVRQWKYTPTLLDGTPRALMMTVTVNFTLN